jgi:nitrate reductase NapE component
LKGPEVRFLTLTFRRKKFSILANIYPCSKRGLTSNSIVLFLFVCLFVCLSVCFLGSATPCVFSSSLALHFFHYSFSVHHPVNRDDRHLRAHAMASDFSVACQFSQRIISFLLIKLHTLIRLGVPCPVLTRVHKMEYCVGLNKAINH